MIKKFLIWIIAVLLFEQGQAQSPDLVLWSYSGQGNIRALNSITLKPGFHIPSGNNVVLSIQEYPDLVGQPSADRNYISTSRFRVPVTEPELHQVRTVGQENRTVEYFDGLGRPVQTIQVMASPDYRDNVQHTEYDGFGRQAHAYLPYADRNGSGGSFKNTAKADQLSYYGSGSWDGNVVRTPTPYAVTVFERSPLNRISEQGAPGEVWQPAAGRTADSGRTVATDYGINTANDVRLWKVTATGANGTAYYAAGTLYGTTMKDENWTEGKAGTIEEYKDLDGRVVLKRLWESEGKKLETYYVYDSFGDLRYVVPPAVTQGSFTEGPADPVFDKYIYAYRYDGYGRVAERKIPGRGWDWTVYNHNDRPILTQDAVQRTEGKWSYTKYDMYGRAVETGIHTGAYADQPAAQAGLDSLLAVNGGVRWESRADSAYSNVTFPDVGLQPLIVNYYDDYGFEGSYRLPQRDIAGSTMTRTLPTGTKVYRDDGSSPLLTVTYYDDHGRPIQTAGENHLGGTDYVTNSYSFVGELLTSKREHSVSPSGAVTTVLTTNRYDHVGRLLETRKKVNNQAEVIQSRLAYNGIGQLTEKKLHSENGGTDFIHTTGYTYNERGWLAKQGSAHFTQELHYNDPASGGTAQYNGNISQLRWGHGAVISETSNYGYDKLNRLLSGAKTGTVMSEVLTYDDMGNITNLKRDGHATGISYSYTGNRLVSVSGQVSGSYTYDANGNATLDRTGMAFTYNHLNLPRTASKSGTSVSYLYDAMGAKLRKTATVGSTATQRDYVGGIEYGKVGTGASTIEMVHTGEGYLQRGQNDVYTYYYNLTDHLGNVRATLQRTTATTGTVVQRHDYYPFGTAKALVTSGINKYLYNGKEQQDELGGQYDYGARFYDAEIGRWNVVDPMAEQMRRHSPYNYAFNNPVRFIDPDGMAPIPGAAELIGWARSRVAEKGGSWDDEEEEQEDPPKKKKGYLNSLIEGTNVSDPFYKTGQTWTKWLGGGPSVILSDIGGIVGGITQGVGSLFYSEAYVNGYNNFRNYLNASPEERGAADGAALGATVEGAATYAPLGVYGHQTLTFQVNGGYGIFGLDGLNIGNYNINFLYANRSLGSGTYLNIKQKVNGGSLFRWDYGTIHGTNMMFPHSTIRFHFNGKQYGNTQQRTFLPTSLKAPFFKVIK